MPEYYDVLCITRSAQREAISKAYRMSSLKYHPDNNSSITDDASRRELEQKFRLVAEAYEVLSDPKYRAIYDCYGEDGLIQQGYKFSGNAIKVFECFFGVDSPFQLLGGHSYFTQEPNRDRSRDSVPPCIVVTLPLTIEEVYTGCRKIISYQTQHYNNADVLVRNVPSQDRTLEVHIPRGVQHETEFYFPSCGNTKDESREPGTVRVKIEILPHERFSISKGTSNLTTVRTISLSEALCGFPMYIRTPDQRQLDIFIDEVVHPSYRRILPGEGMPVYDSTDEHTASAPKTTVFGDLVIEFRTEFPRYLSASQKGEIARILDLKS